MAFQPEAITRLQPWSDEIAKLIEDLDTTSSEARVVYGKIGRACTLANERSGRLRERANQTTRTGRVAGSLCHESAMQGAMEHRTMIASKSFTTHMALVYGDSDPLGKLLMVCLAGSLLVKVFPLLRRSVWRHWRETEVLHGRA